MLKKIISFIKYNTFTAVIAAVAFVAVASAVASNEGVKNKIIGEEIVEKSGVDNSALLAADLDNFDLEMEIANVTQDAEPALTSEEAGSSLASRGKAGNYYIDYQYKTLGIQDDVWQEIFRQKQMTVSKAALEGRDLGIYVTEELGEIIDYEIAYLKEVQKNEEEKGQTYITEKTEYTGLIGLVLNTKTKELPGYEPVVKPPEIAVQSTPENPTTPTPPSQGGDSGAPVNGDLSAGSPYYLWLVKNCMDNGKYWYNDTCNAAPEIISAPTPTPLATPQPSSETTAGNAEPVAEAGTTPPLEGGDATTPTTPATPATPTTPTAPTAPTPEPDETPQDDSGGNQGDLGD